MPIPFTCTCGRKLRVNEDLAGRKVRCPGCSNVTIVPDLRAEPVEEVGDVYPCTEPEKPTRQRRAVRSESPRDEGIGVRRREPDAPLARKRRSAPRIERDDFRRPPRVAFEEGWFGSLNAGIIGGVLMILIAIIWFVGGLAVGIIFFYPPVLAIVGVIAFIKGMMGRD